MDIVSMKNPSDSHPVFYRCLLGYAFSLIVPLFQKDSVSNAIFTLASTYYTRFILLLYINCLLTLAILN